MDLQELIALMFAGLAAAYVAWRVWRSLTMSSRSGGSCGGCVTPLNAPRQKTLISIVPLSSHPGPKPGVGDDSVKGDEPPAGPKIGHTHRSEP